MSRREFNLQRARVYITGLVYRWWQRSAVMWGLMAAQLRGMATGEVFANAESNPDARFVMHQLAARGIPENERADMLWAMLAAYLRGEVVAQLPQEDVIDVAEIARLMDEW